VAGVPRRTFLVGLGAGVGVLAGRPLAGLLDEDEVWRLRPPGAAAPDRLRALCIRCGQCVEVCPPGCLSLLSFSAGRDAATPVVEARRRGCTLCLDEGGLRCAEVCPTEALVPVATEMVAMGSAVVDADACRPHAEDGCRSCSEACPIADDALTLAANGIPHVVHAACVGCGRCEEVCPAETPAIVVGPLRGCRVRALSGRGGGGRGNGAGRGRRAPASEVGGSCAGEETS